MRYIRQIKFYILNKLFRINLNKEYKTYTIYHIDGSNSIIDNKLFNIFKEGIIENLYNKYKCYIEVTNFSKTEQELIDNGLLVAQLEPALELIESFGTDTKTIIEIVKNIDKEFKKPILEKQV